MHGLGSREGSISEIPRRNPVPRSIRKVVLEQEVEMRVMKTSTVLGLLVLLGGCLPVPSLHPLFTENDMVFEPALLGAWGEKEGEEAILTFEQLCDNAYELTYIDNEKTSRYKAYLVRVGEFLFLDAYPDGEAFKELAAAEAHLPVVPTHIFVRVWLEGDALRIAYLDDEWLEAKIEAGEVQIAHERTGDYLVLTAAPKELQALVLQYAEDESAFDPSSLLYRRQ